MTNDIVPKDQNRVYLLDHCLGVGGHARDTRAGRAASRTRGALERLGGSSSRSPVVAEAGVRSVKSPRAIHVGSSNIGLGLEAMGFLDELAGSRHLGQHVCQASDIADAFRAFVLAERIDKRSINLVNLRR
jgi:hypothetical protein